MANAYAHTMTTDRLWLCTAGPRHRVLHVRAVLVAVLRAEHRIRHLSGVPDSRPRGERVSVAGLCVVDDKSNYLHDIQQNVSSRLYSTAAL